MGCCLHPTGQARALSDPVEVQEAAYCVVEVRIGEDTADVAKKRRELAAQVERVANSDVRSVRTLEQATADRGAGWDRALGPR
jgi:hypothetical protein